MIAAFRRIDWKAAVLFVLITEGANYLTHGRFDELLLILFFAISLIVTIIALSVAWHDRKGNVAQSLGVVFFAAGCTCVAAGGLAHNKALLVLGALCLIPAEVARRRGCAPTFAQWKPRR